jgi:histidine triad (HIT) family protein
MINEDCIFCKIAKGEIPCVKIWEDEKHLAFLDLNPIHIKLYPIHGLNEKFVETWANDKIYFDKYTGYISTQLGPEASAEKRKEVAEKILKNQ